MDEKQMIRNKLLEMERTALDRWGRGDPSGYLEISDKGVSYFDPFVNARIDGLENLRQYYESIRGQVNVDRDAIIDPCVQTFGITSILAFKYYSQSGKEVMRWNCTEVYRKIGDDWAIVHTHWAFNSQNKESW